MPPLAKIEIAATEDFAVCALESAAMGGV